MSNLARTFRTICYLRPSQLYWRLRYRHQNGRPVVSPRIPNTLVVRKDFPAQLTETNQGATNALSIHDALNSSSENPDADVAFIDQLEQGHFTHLNETQTLGIDPVDWLLGDQNTNRLWAVTLHYHGWAVRLARLVLDGGELGTRADRLLRRLLGDWITRCDLTVAGSRALAWNAYAIATRIGNWCRAYHTLGDQGRANWGTLDTVFLENLWSQAAYLHDHLEWDLRANHLLRDTVGLAWAGRFFEGPRPRRWLSAATQMATRQAAEQVLPDGGHFEHSPMYHVEVMDDLATLAVLLRDKHASEQLNKTWHRMAEFLAWARHPDGQIPLLNDGGLNGTCSPQSMLNKGKSLLGIEVNPAARTGGRFFNKFGLIVWHGNPWSVFFDVGQVGPDYQPGHTHADTLTFEASYKGRRVFVDPGTFRYDNDESRRYDRATTSHNTMAIDGIDSSEVWHIFRVGRRARPIGIQFNATGESLHAAAAHTGYDHLSGRPRHRRSLDINGDTCLTVTDQITGRGSHAISAGLLLDPAWTPEPIDGGWQLQCDEHVLTVLLESPESVSIQTSIQDAVYHPEYGLEMATKRLVWEAKQEPAFGIVLRVVPQKTA